MSLLRHIGCRVPHISILRCGLAGFFLATSLSAQEPRPFTLQQILSAPYASLLTAAPTGPLFAWTEDAEGRHNLFIGGRDIPARQLTHNTEDDAQDISQLAWSPDAKFIAYTFGAPSGADGKPANPAHLQRPTPVQVIIQPVDGSAAIIVGEGRSPLFMHDGKSLLFIRGGQIFTTCLLNCHPERSLAASSQGAVEGPASPEQPQSSTRQLVFDRGTASSLTLSPDGQTLAFISRRREANEPSHSFLALYTFATHTLTFPAPSTANDSAPAFSPDGKELAWLRAPFTDFPEFANPRVSPNPWSIEIALAPVWDRYIVTYYKTGSKEIKRTESFYQMSPNSPGSVLPNLSTGSPKLFWTNPAEHFRPHLIYFSEVSGWVNLWALQFDGATSGPREHEVASGKFEVEDAALSNNSKTLYYTSNDTDSDPLNIDRRHIWQVDISVNDATPRQITHGTGIETSPLASADGGSLATLASDAQHPMHSSLIDAHGNLTEINPEATPVTYPASSLVTPQQIIFPSTNNLQIHSQLFLPENLDPNKKHPAILFLHGGPMRQMLLGYPAMDYYSNAYAMNQYLTSRGFIVLSVNYRCGIGYGLNFHQCEGEGATGAKEYDDVLAAQKYLASRPDVDSKRIGLWGGSYGGYLTALGLARNSDLFAAGVDFHGVHDWNFEDNASDWKQGSFAQQDAIAAKALASSPLGDISKWSSPVLLIHGDNDPDVAFAQTPHLADALRARNSKLPAAQQVDVQELIFPDELHGFLLHRDWLTAYTAAAAFFERILKP